MATNQSNTISGRGNFTNHRVRPIIERFLEKILPEPNSGCWLWLASLNSKGYGQFYRDPHESKAPMGAHVFSYEHFVEPVPEGLTLDHLCRVRSCVNPRHLEPVTHKVNVERGDAGKHHRDLMECPSGHPYSGDNLVVYEITVKGRKYINRQCRACHAIRNAAKSKRVTPAST